ncbi:hypothetical protein IFM89_016356 [Coptis chinensis]|uniref:Uncharacterized protein n=1 Tax=Coptis chinensis TaxID=261450 RepID=A0A835HBC9_9MAGN|nr:hypothetical protein IFM89_016356 [Coptis chinensis]
MDTEDQESNLKTGPTTKEGITDEVTCVVATPRGSNVRITEKKSDVMEDEHQAVKPSRNNMAKYRESLPMAIEEEVKKNSDSHFHPVSSLDKADIDALRECSGNKTKTTNEVNVQKTSAKMNQRVDNVLPKVLIGGVETCNTSKEANIQLASDRLIKFTFQRKRKKGSLSDPDENEYQEHYIVKRRAEENQIGALAPHKFDSIMARSRATDDDNMLSSRFK